MKKQARVQIEERKLTDLVFTDYNAKSILTAEDEEFQKLDKSIAHFSYVEPIVINKDNSIIDGQQRVNNLIQQGYTHADVIIVDLNKDDEMALSLALNKIKGDFTDEKLLYLLNHLKDIDYDTSLTGFDDVDFSNLLAEFDEGQPPEDDEFDFDEEIEDDEKVVITQPGDIWTLGNHRVMCGNSTNSDDVKALMNDVKAQMIITDPPYNVDYEGATEDRLKISNDNMSDSAFYDFLLAAFTNMFDTSEKGAAIYVFHADTEGLNFRSSFKDAGFDLKQCLVWVKNTMVLGRQDYQWRHEPILYGWKPGAAHNFKDDRTLTTVIDDSTRPNLKAMKRKELVKLCNQLFDQIENIDNSIVYCDKPTRSAEHPTMKPVKMVGRFILNSSKPGWIVQDLFGGSGSTLIACEKTNRIAYLMELEGRFVDVIVKRYVKTFGADNCSVTRKDGTSYSYNEVFKLE